MSILEAVIQAIIQGFTEFLPVSSSGHLSLFQHFTGLDGEGALATSVVLHLGTLLAVFIAFWERIWSLIKEFFSMIKDIFTGKFKWKTMNPERRMIIMIVISILPLFLFYIFEGFFTGLAEDSSILVEGFCFLYTAALLLITSKFSKGSKDAAETTVKDSLTVGIFQGIALLPGVSRSGSTICSGMLRGFKKEYAVEYSFILGIPVILAGSVLELKDAITEGARLDILPLLIGFAVSAVCGIAAIKLIKWLVVSDKFVIFGYYTLILGIIVVGIGIFEAVVGQSLPVYFGWIAAD